MNRKLWFEQMKKDYPNVPDYIITWMLDIYEKNPDFYNKKTGKKGRPKKQKVLFEIEKILQDRPRTQEIQSVKFLPSGMEEEKPSADLVVNEGGYIEVSNEATQKKQPYTLTWD
jgi:hypothetical protein